MLSACPTCGIVGPQTSHIDEEPLKVDPHLLLLSSADRQCVQNNILDIEEDIAVLDQQIRRLRASLSNLRRVRKQKEDQLKRQKCVVAPIWSLPVEILAEIFILAADDGHCVDNLDTRQSIPRVVSHVCQLWRNVALSTSTLWSTLYFDDTTRRRNDPFPTELLQMYLERSKQSPLSFSVNSSNDVTFVLECFASDFHRLHTLEMTLCLPGWKTLSELVADVPKLTILHLSFEGAYIHWRRVDGWEEPVKVFLSAPLLNDVRLEGIGISQVHFPSKRLKRFAGDLHLVEECNSLFRNLSEVVEAELWVRHMIVSHQIPAEGLTWHTRLRQLSLYSDAPCLGHIRLPALQHFRIEGISHYFMPELRSDIETFIRESRCPLETLLLEIVPLHYSSLSSILETCATTLTRLSLRVDMDGAKDVYDALTFDGITCLAPHVDDLTLRDDSCTLGPDRILDWSFEASFHQEAFMRMVQSRWGLPGHRGDGARLRSLTLCAPYSSKPSEILNTLAEFEEEGLAVEFHGYATSAHFETKLGTES
ncbi:hypothetical protein ARMSODRAFT_1087800 [Armillaria solidipes]|uniref:F-box domain-containing protein n=1 Tax=Armillaria solidipes TaxID=1076256 RepID=A0A2H3BF40_9AGAR|nr:hypothetical protein ARMSODRAFT_1087800 [Armillaria solidipes]